ncbi:hypothetical protein EVAR_93011_1 [Eumeta japonica]|uniref:Uncharacterized protein n=1 Tax=Eumeta variegata TaxID=151549 RepID=A0A4C1TAP4_EUMVA|nr:hypothetical protein EVAR_93011_1 [Eumeta japonica]
MAPSSEINLNLNFGGAPETKNGPTSSAAVSQVVRLAQCSVDPLGGAVYAPSSQDFAALLLCIGGSAA